VSEYLDYENTRKYWDGRFAAVDANPDSFDPGEPLALEELERAVQWLGSGSGKIIFDLGCGTGKCLLRAGYCGFLRGHGLDISQKAIDIAKRRAVNFGMDDNFSFISSGIESISDMPTKIDAVILSNIIDNLVPRDSRRLVDHIHSRLAPSGRVFLKLNDYYSPDEISRRAIMLSPDFYQEREGIFLWNLSDAEVQELFSSFCIAERREITYPEDAGKNRIWYLQKK